MNREQKNRVRIVFIGIVVASLVVAYSLYTIQIRKGKTYVAKAAVQYGKPVASVFDRGTIYFSSKDGTHVAAATVENGNIVSINPKLVTDPEQTYTALSEYIKIDKTSFDSIFDHKNGETYKELAHRVSDETAKSIRNLAIKGVGVSRESWRAYPGGLLASHILGLVGQDQSTSTIQGKYGLERFYENTLDRDSAGSGGLFIQLFSGGVSSGSNVQGDLVTTIEPTVQSYLEKILSDTLGVWHSDEIGGIVMDPQTGEIIAMSSLPTFNGNDTSSVKNAAVFSNPLVEHAYEMGSIVKPITMSIGLDSGVITPSSTYNDTGTMTLNNKTIGNYDGKARGITDMQTILSQSLNVGAATIGLKVGADTFAKYLSEFGLGDKTGVDLPSEATGLIGNLKSGREIDVATASYGQGIAISPMGTARALAVLANGGYVVTPHVVKEIDYTDGTKKIINTDKKGPILQPSSALDVTKMLVQVVDTALKKGAIKNERYTVAAKTGTAQIADRVNGGYYKDKYLHSFFGYFPAYNPHYLVFLYQIYPKGAQYASETLTDPFDNLSKFLINYYDVAPDR